MRKRYQQIWRLPSHQEAFTIEQLTSTEKSHDPSLSKLRLTEQIGRKNKNIRVKHTRRSVIEKAIKNVQRILSGNKNKVKLGCDRKSSTLI